MTEQYAGALLYLVPVIVAAIVAFVVTRPEKDAAEPASPVPAPARRIPVQRSYSPDVHVPSAHVPAAGPGTYGPNRRGAAAPAQSPTLLHAALSSHLAAVSGGATSATAPLSAKLPVVRPNRLVSIRRPARIPRRPLYRCPHRPA